MAPEALTTTQVVVNPTFRALVAVWPITSLARTVAGITYSTCRLLIISLCTLYHALALCSRIILVEPSCSARWAINRGCVFAWRACSVAGLTSTDYEILFEVWVRAGYQTLIRCSVVVIANRRARLAGQAVICGCDTARAGGVAAKAGASAQEVSYIAFRANYVAGAFKARGDAVLANQPSVFVLTNLANALIAIQNGTMRWVTREALIRTTAKARLAGVMASNKEAVPIASWYGWSVGHKIIVEILAGARTIVLIGNARRTPNVARKAFVSWIHKVFNWALAEICRGIDCGQRIFTENASSDCLIRASFAGRVAQHTRTRCWASNFENVIILFTCLAIVRGCLARQAANIAGLTIKPEG